MLGSMVETDILSTAAAHIAPLADWLDLDAPLMLVDSPFHGVTYADGVLSLPHGAGLGISGSIPPTAALANTAEASG